MLTSAGMTPGRQLMLIQRISCESPIGQNRTSCTFVVNGPVPLGIVDEDAGRILHQDA